MIPICTFLYYILAPVGDDVVFIMWDCNPTPTIIPLTDLIFAQTYQVVDSYRSTSNACLSTFPRLSHMPLLFCTMIYYPPPCTPLFPSHPTSTNPCTHMVLARMQGRSTYSCFRYIPVVAFVVSLLPSVSPFWPVPFVAGHLDDAG